jgi:hypothetical protein
MNIDVVDFELSLLSPLHVGSDEHVDPTNALFHEGMLWDGIDLFSAVKAGPVREELKRITLHFSNQSFENFKRSNVDSLLPWAERTTPVAKGMQDQFNKSMSNLPARRTSFDSLTFSPMIPGSSLKGSLRGLLLGGTMGERFTTSEWKFSADPLSMISVADLFPCNPRSARTCFAGAERLYKHNAKVVRGLDETRMGFWEIVLPASSAFRGQISIKVPHTDRKLSAPAFTKTSLFSTCKNQMNKFLSQTGRDDRKFWQSSDLDVLWPNSGLGEAFSELLADVQADPASLLLRLGSASGAEHTSLDWLRSLWNGKNDGKPPHTWTVAKFAANKRIPMGWVVLTDLKSKSDATRAWQVKLDKIAEKIRSECPNASETALEQFKLKKNELMLAQEKAKNEERLALAEKSERERIEREKMAAVEAQRASWSEFLRNLDSLCERIEKSAQPIQVNNNLWQSVVKFSNDFASQNEDDKHKALEWFTQRIEVKLAVPKDKLKELKRRLS